MFERLRGGNGATRPAARDREDVRGGNGGGTADRTAVQERPAGAADRAAVRERPAGTAARERPAGPATAEALRAARARQRDQFGGINWGAAFFGWLVAIGLGVLLVAILAAAGAAVGLTSSPNSSNADTIGLGGAIALLLVLMVAYYAGGYVAGRMSRFDGARQGGAAWVIGLAVTLILAVAGVLLGDQYNVLSQLNLPALPVGKSTLASGGLIALAAILAGTLVAALVGGKAGERYHRRVDRAGFVD